MASLTNDKLRELALRHTQSEFIASDAEERTAVREISTEFFSNSITAIMQIMDQFRDNGLDNEYGSKTERGALEMISCYQELLHERKLKKRQFLTPTSLRRQVCRRPTAQSFIWCIIRDDLYKIFLKKVHYYYTHICTVTYPHLCNVIRTPFSAVLVSAPHSRNVF
jgi:hypothetical protein